MEGFLGARQALMRLAGLHRALTLGAMLLAATPAFACLDTFSSEVLEARRSGDAALLARAAAAAEAAHRQAPTLQTTNDLAVAWILTGRGQEAVRLLRDLDAGQPGNAVVASNLGMALELSGAEEEALQWIRESVRRDPQEHQGSEWLHVRILEAKLALKWDPHWLRRNSVVGWREGQRMPLDERSRPRAPQDMLRAIRYQIAERTLFVEPPDPIVGDLYLTMGDLVLSVPGTIQGSWERDQAVAAGYERALTFGTVHESRARERLARTRALLEAARPAREAAAARDRESRRREQERERSAATREAELERAQERRRWMALIAFGTFGIVVTAVVLWRGRRRASDG
jgi:tetratricopeptide (TPR) repeat protein